MSSDAVDRAIRLLAENAAFLTLDQRLRIAALLARPIEPEPSYNRDPVDPPPTEAVVLTVEETADLLRVGRTTVYDLIKSGGLTSIMIGRLRRVRYADVVAYLDQTDRR
ncbi:helix-turn-helix domain-containing protein [Actinoplanes sp. NPDC049265]|uniref:helix-turn-helix domain-containing protein n=1 Tax=Actinoplanes sp. NPDC049265 TaxID=3363902 RepID=UPI0037239A4D